MLIKDLILKNPLSVLSRENEPELQTGQFGAVLARAGVGKTSFLVQLALFSLLNNQKVLHISLDDPVNKVNLWYEEVFRIIGGQYRTEPIQEIWDGILPNRFIMTFKVEGFSVPKLEERLTDLISQNIFTPKMVIIDGLPFDSTVRDTLNNLKLLSEKLKVSVWFTVLTHRHEQLGENGLPVQLDSCDDLFQSIIQLQPENDRIAVNALRGVSDTQSHPLFIDPATLIVTDK